jgi:hypothetical protein
MFSSGRMEALPKRMIVVSCKFVCDTGFRDPALFYNSVHAK